MSAKRQKSDYPDEESEKVNSLKEKIIEADEKLKKKAVQLESMEEELRKMARENDSLEIDLKYANDEILRFNFILSSMHMLEWFKRKHPKMPDEVRQKARSDHWCWIFDNDLTFRNNVYKCFGSQPSARRVAKIIEEIYHNPSAHQQLSHAKDDDYDLEDKSKGLQISSADYSSDQQHILQAICATIPCNITIE